MSSVVDTVLHAIGVRHPNDVVEWHDPPDFDGFLLVTKGPIGFWRRTCSACEFSTVNGVPEAPAEPKPYGDGEYLDHPGQAETPAFKSLEARYLDGEKVKWETGEFFDVKTRRDGTRVVGNTVICPSCGETLIRATPDLVEVTDDGGLELMRGDGDE